MLASQFDSLIFDLDGTLWDTAEICARGWNEAIQASGVPYREITTQDLISIMGLTAEELRVRFFPHLSIEDGRDLLRQCFHHEVDWIRREGGVLYPGVREGLKQLASKFSLFLVSNCDGPYLEAFFESSGLGEYFKDSECHGNTKLSKGENIAGVIARNHLKSPIYMGDTLGDQRGAEFAGIPFAFVEYGFGKAEKCDLSFKTFEGLVLHFSSVPGET